MSDFFKLYQEIAFTNGPPEIVPKPGPGQLMQHMKQLYGPLKKKKPTPEPEDVKLAEPEYDPTDAKAKHMEEMSEALFGLINTLEIDHDNGEKITELIEKLYRSGHSYVRQLRGQ